ncbi:MAG TPA: AMP-binding protein [Solirubrobacteraceae bacterium]|jgi:crotonobetaine/carnitine-CoA ligase
MQNADDHSDPVAVGGERMLMRGRGLDLGQYATRFPFEQRSLLHVLAAQAQTRPGATWLVFDGRDSLTYKQAFELVNCFGNALAERLPSGGQVALFLRNQLEFMPAFLGAMAGGGVTVPLNADSRGPLLEYVIRKSEAKIIVARADLLDRLSALASLGEVELVVVCGQAEGLPKQIHGAETITWEQLLAGQPAIASRPLPDSWETSLVQFTSGTTGNSKGVVYSHHFLYLYSALLADAQERSSEDVLTTPLPLFHVAALHQVAACSLHAGCSGHLKSRFSASRFWQEAAEDGATWSIFLGPMAEIILKTVKQAPPHRLQEIFCVPFPPNGVEFESRFGVKFQWQGYGMTEVYPLPMKRKMLEGVERDTIGSPPPWMEFGVVDEHDRVLAPGEVGELVFRPRIPYAMTSGYFKAPEATVEAFRGMMFHTGDLGAYDEQLLLHYRGRREDRIRRRGENISAVELEYVAMRHEHVVEAAAYGVPGEFGEHEVKLDVVLGGELDLDDLHRWLVEQLPRYMVPRYLECLQELPKTPSQKIQKYKLAEASLERESVRVYEQAGRKQQGR